ncbi:MAG: STAS domain-containing protein [Alphaproteobacteria bacterium]|nr:STAS domain-containing protein [Alphaproteobacteria bacterium]
MSDVCILHPVGRIDGSSSADFQTKLLEAIGRASGGVVIDFNEIDYISSAGLRALMTAVRQRKDRHLAVAGLRPVIVEIFEIARFQHVIKIFGTAAEAISSWSTPRP